MFLFKFAYGEPDPKSVVREGVDPQSVDPQSVDPQSVDLQSVDPQMSGCPDPKLVA